MRRKGQVDQDCLAFSQVQYGSETMGRTLDAVASFWVKGEIPWISLSIVSFLDILLLPN